MRTAAAAAAPPPPPPPGERSARLSPAMDGSPRLSPLHPSISATAGMEGSFHVVRCGLVHATSQQH